MRRVRWLVALVLLFAPGVAHAIQLHWASGADTLTFTEATRAILVVRADSAEVTLPPEWRLLWLGDSTEVEIVALDSLEICEGDTARVYGVRNLDHRNEQVCLVPDECDDIHRALDIDEFHHRVRPAAPEQFIGNVKQAGEGRRAQPGDLQRIRFSG